MIFQRTQILKTTLEILYLQAEKAANDLRDSLNGSNRRVRRRTT